MTAVADESSPASPPPPEPRGDLPLTTGALISGVMVLAAACVYGVLSNDWAPTHVAMVIYVAGFALCYVLDVLNLRHRD